MTRKRIAAIVVAINEAPPAIGLRRGVERTGATGSCPCHSEERSDEGSSLASEHRSRSLAALGMTTRHQAESRQP